MFQTVFRVALLITLQFVFSGSASAWGDEGHEVVALVADHYLDPAVKTKVDAILKKDAGKLTAHDIAAEATWADKYRDSDRNSTKVHYNQTHNWHYVDIEIKSPDQDAACFGHPAIPKKKVASSGPTNDCVVDKINEFAAELKAPGTSKSERLKALQFLLHFVGDLHQPLHASDDQDSGGNSKLVTAAGLPAGNLHHYWDAEFVQRVGKTPGTVADELIASITSSQVSQWSGGTPADWANEAFAVARSKAYGALPAKGTTGKYALSAAYVDDATGAVKEQLSRAGVRLASVLNAALQ